MHFLCKPMQRGSAPGSRVCRCACTPPSRGGYTPPAGGCVVNAVNAQRCPMGQRPCAAHAHACMAAHAGRVHGTAVCRCRHGGGCALGRRPMPVQSFVCALPPDPPCALHAVPTSVCRGRCQADVASADCRVPGPFHYMPHPVFLPAAERVIRTEFHPGYAVLCRRVYTLEFGCWALLKLKQAC